MVITKTGDFKGKKICYNDRMVVITAAPRLAQRWRVLVLNSYTWEVTKERMLFLVNKKNLVGYTETEAVNLHNKAKTEKRDSYVGRVYLMGKLYVAITMSSISGASGAVLQKNDHDVDNKYFWTFVVLLLAMGVSIPYMVKVLLQMANYLQFERTTTTTTTTSATSQTTTTATTSSTTQTEPTTTPTPTASVSRTVVNFVHITPTGECWHIGSCPNLGHRATRYRQCKVCMP